MVRERRYMSSELLEPAFLLIVAWSDSFAIVTDLTVLTDSNGVFAGLTVDSHGNDLLYFPSRERVEQVRSMILDDAPEFKDIKVVALSSDEATRDKEVNRLMVEQAKSDVFMLNLNITELQEDSVGSSASESEVSAMDEWIESLRIS
jgi:hypothetical protein